MTKPLRQNNQRMRSMGGIVSYGCWCNTYSHGPKETSQNSDQNNHWYLSSIRRLTEKLVQDI